MLPQLDGLPDEPGRAATEVAPRPSACARRAGPAAGAAGRRRSSSASPSPSATRCPAPISGLAPARPRPRRRSAARPAISTNVPGHGLVGPDLRARARPPAGPGRGGRPRGGAAGSASRPSSGCGTAGSSPAQPRPEARVRSRAAPPPSSRVLEGRARSRSHRAPRAPARRSGRCRGPRPCASGVTPGLGVAGQDRGRDRRRSAVPRQQRRMEVEGPVRQVEQRRRARSGRSRRGPRAPAGAPGPRRRLGRRAAAPGVRIAATPSCRGARRRPASAVSACAPAGRSRRRRDDADQRRPRARRAEPSQDRDAEPAAPEEDGPARASGRARPGGHASAARRLADLRVVLVADARPASARPSSRGSRCRACRRGGRARAGAPGRGARTRRP